MKKKMVICLCIILFFMTIICYGLLAHKQTKRLEATAGDRFKESQMHEHDSQLITSQKEKNKTISNMCISTLSAQREDIRHIKLRWADNMDNFVTGYSVQRYDNRTINDTNTWVAIGKVGIKEHKKGSFYEYIDELDSANPQQYIYRVVPQLRDHNTYTVTEQPKVICSNWKICIDPGHYEGKNGVPGADSYGYTEGDFTLQIALELRKKLEKEYGIAVSMTRNSGNISIDGYTNASLDSKHISLRGAYAAEQDCNLFISIHTNANAENANNVDTFHQPISINKPIVIANDQMLSSDILREVCNEVGKNLAEVSYDLGISSYKDFTVLSGEVAREWTTSYNDSITEQGTVVCRHGDHGQYYGVLRGAQEAGIPGIIIEHGYHTVVEMREAAKNGNLKNKWADADAEGIASAMKFRRLSK